MGKYQVITVLDDVRERSYYWSYQFSEDATLGNITVNDLPPYADINKARACYWDSTNCVWIYDETKYSEIIADIEQTKAEIEAEKERIESIPTNEELNDMLLSVMGAINELAKFDDTVLTPLTDLAALVVKE